MNIRVVWMRVQHGLVPMPMSVRRRVSHRRIGGRMDVSMMFVVHVGMVMVLRLVTVFVLVALADV